MAIGGSYSKTDSRKGTHTIRLRVLPPLLSELLVAFLTVVRPFQAILDRCERGGEQGSRAVDTLLFTENSKPPAEGYLRKWLTRALVHEGAPGFGVREYRHAYVAYGRRLLGEDFVDDEEGEEETGSSLFDLQADHSSLTATNIYARSSSMPATLDVLKIAGYAQISDLWGNLIGVLHHQPEAPVEMGPLNAPPSHISALQAMPKGSGAITFTPYSRDTSPAFSTPFKAASTPKAQKRRSIGDLATPRDKRNSLTSPTNPFPTPPDSVQHAPSVAGLSSARSLSNLRTPSGPAAISMSRSTSAPSTAYSVHRTSPLKQTHLLLASDTPPTQPARRNIQAIITPAPLFPSLEPARAVPVTAAPSRTETNDVFGQVSQVNQFEVVQAFKRFMRDETATVRQGQETIIQRTRLNTTALVLVLPTGFGKTFAYTTLFHLPDYRGLTVVIVPLVALHADLKSRFESLHLQFVPKSL